MDLISLERVLQLMRHYRVRRVELDGLGEVEIDLDSTGDAPPVNRAVPASQEPSSGAVTVDPDAMGLTACPCGHSVEIEHGASGCYRGCDVATCMSDRERPPSTPTPEVKR